MASSTASANLNPSAPKSLMPLSAQGLCEAEMTTPAWNPCVLARNATAGVVTTPALSTMAPAWRRPSASVAAIHGPDSRVSRPKKNFGPRHSFSQSMREREPDAKDRRWIERGLSGNGANAVGAKEFACSVGGHFAVLLPRLSVVGAWEAPGEMVSTRLEERSVGEARGELIARADLRRGTNELAF